MTLDGLRERCGREWAAIRRSEVAATETLARIREQVENPGGPAFDSSDLSMVVFGSLARGEWTLGSDLDWTILVDGQADHEHANTAGVLRERLDDAGFREPGRTGLFGRLAFSHNLIHQIGGPDDTNRNTTQRMLMLLESRPVHKSDAYDRTLTGILRRYLKDDPAEFRPKVPRFLLNDLNRYWRTMCVDYANKYRDRSGEGWALRKLKLRMSRKLIFASGLLTCLECDEGLFRTRSPELADDPSVDAMVTHLNDCVRRLPLAVLAEAAGRYASVETARDLFDSYDRFLAALDDPEIRQHLHRLAPATGESDPKLQDLLGESRVFHSALTRLFFQDHPGLAALTREYGIF